MVTPIKLPRKPNPPAPVHPAVRLMEYHPELGYGKLTIDDKFYHLFRLRDGGRVVGVRLVRVVAEGDSKIYDVDFTAEHGWTCDCDDATYRPDREGGCKHLVAVRQVVREMRCARTPKVEE